MSCKSGSMCGSSTTSMKACYGKPFHQERTGVVTKNANGDNVPESIGCTGDPPADGGRRSRRRKTKSRRGKSRKTRRH
jgi:hypothetical protein